MKQFDLTKMAFYRGGVLQDYYGAPIATGQNADTALFNVVGGEVQGFKNLSGTLIPSVSYDVASMAELAALNAAALPGEVVRYKAAGLVGDGAQDFYLFSDGAVWKFFGGKQLLFARTMGSLASGALSLSAVGAFGLTNNPQIPANLIHSAGMGVEVTARAHRHGTHVTTAMFFRSYFGTNTTFNSNDVLNGVTVGNADLTDAMLSGTVYRLTATSALFSKSIQVNNAGVVGGLADATTNIDFAAVQRVFFGVGQIEAGNSLDLLTYSIWGVNG